VPSFYTIMFAFRGSKAAPTDTIEQVLNAHVSDWARFAATGYIVALDGDAKALSDALRVAVPTEDSFLILRADLHGRRGWAPQVVVDWLSKYVP